MYLSISKKMKKLSIKGRKEINRETKEMEVSSHKQNSQHTPFTQWLSNAPRIFPYSSVSKKL